MASNGIRASSDISDAKKDNRIDQIALMYMFLKKYPSCEADMRQRICSGKPIILKGTKLPKDCVHEALLRFSSSKGEKGECKKRATRISKDTRPSASPQGKRLRLDAEADVDVKTPTTTTESKSPRQTNSDDGEKAQEVPSEPPPEPVDPASHAGVPEPPKTDASIATLKEYFTQLQVEYRHRAFEREDLLSLLADVITTLSKPLAQLRTEAKCPSATAIECLGVLLNPSSKRRESVPCAPSAPSAPPSTTARAGAAGSRRVSEGGNGSGVAAPLDGLGEAARICRVHEAGYSWYYTALNLKHNATLEDVQRQYRAYMKMLHPDKFRGSDIPPVVSQALEKVKKAKKAAETELNRMSVRLPGQVQSLTWTLVCAIPRQRVISLKWQHPGGQVDKYTIQVMDPSYGRFLNICVLEPDYYEDKHKFVSIEELNEYLIEEKKLEKMSHLFDCAAHVEFQVAAQNSAGIGPYAKMKVDMSGKTFAHVAKTPAAPSRFRYQSPHLSSVPEDIDTLTFKTEVVATYVKKGDVATREYLSRRKVREKRAFLAYMGLKSTGNLEDLTQAVFQWLRENV